MILKQLLLLARYCSPRRHWLTQHRQHEDVGESMTAGVGGRMVPMLVPAGGEASEHNYYWLKNVVGVATEFSS
jgi:hypothetical protein